MAPSAALQARIKQFESLDSAHGASQLPNRDRPRPSYPPVRGIQAAHTISAPSSSVDLLSDSVSPLASSYAVIKPTVPYEPRKPRIKSQSPSPSPPNLGCNTSLIDLKDWVLEDGSTSSTLSPRTAGSAHGWSKPAVAPPLPPRNVSQDSTTSSSFSSRSPSVVPPKLPSRSSSNSLTVEHFYPPLSKTPSNSGSRQRQGHIPASSTSSFHSVSLSSDGELASEVNGTDTESSSSKFVAMYPMDKVGANGVGGRDKDRDSVDDTVSIRTVSSTGISSPTLSSTHEWEKDFSTLCAKGEPQVPYLRRVPPLKISSSPAVSPPTHPASPIQMQRTGSNMIRRIPPPPPSRSTKSPSTPSRASSISSAPSASDRSSIFSTMTMTTAHTSIGSYTQLFRPTPVPLVARKRYEAVFFANINAQRRVSMKQLSPNDSPNPGSLSPASPSTPRKGWRGLSVDLVTNPEDNPVLAAPPEEDGDASRLDCRVVKSLWSNSGLLRETLRDIWNDCALPGVVYLEKDGFVKGMWRIDEELRRAQSSRSSRISPAMSRKRTENLLH